MPLCAGKISCYVKRKCKSELEYPCISPQFTLLEHYPITSNPTSVFFTPFLAAASLSLFRFCALPILACGVKITHSILGRGVPRTRLLGMVAKPQNGSRGQTKVLQVRSERVVQCIICEIGVTGRFTVAPPTGKDTK